MIDGRALTAWRTACASALAARYLAREDASHLVMVGAGALAPHLVRAHASVRPIKRVTLWNRTKAAAVSLGFARRRRASSVDIADDLEEAVREADIVSCATLAEEPLVQGRLAEEGRASRSGRRLHAEDARSRRRRDPARADLCRYPRRRAEGGGRYRRFR